MADKSHINIFISSEISGWNLWREQNPEIIPDLSGEDFSGIELYGWTGFFDRYGCDNRNLSGVNFSGARLSGWNLSGADLSGANLSRADLSRADLSGRPDSGVPDPTGFPGRDIRAADLTGADLSGADLSGANLSGVDFSGTNLSGVDFSYVNPSEVNLSRVKNLSGAILSGWNLSGVNLSGADLSGANLSEADLTRGTLVKTDLKGTTLTGCRIYGISVWGTNLEGAKQWNLNISEANESAIMVDNLEVAQFVYLLLNHRNLRIVLNAITERGVLILGRFGEGGLEVLEAIAAKLRESKYQPFIFDFDRPDDRNYTETVKTLVGLSRFVIVDLSGPSVPQELYATVPHFKIPFVPIIEESRRQYSMAVDILEYPWVLNPPVRFVDVEHLVRAMPTQIIAPAEEWVKARQDRLADLFDT
jgi:uncharacterized protein YjbI with pentapeptide repeats